MVVGLAFVALGPARPADDRAELHFDAGGAERGRPRRSARSCAARACSPRSSAAIASFAAMVAVMNLTGYVVVDHGHHQSDVFP